MFSNDLEVIEKVQSGHVNSEYLLDNIDIIKEVGCKRVLRQVDAMNKLIRPPLQPPQKRYRKGTRPVEATLRNCIYCNNIIGISEHTCKMCATVQEDTWLEMPTIAEMQYKHQTHSIPCAYKRINHFNEKLAQFQGKEKTIIPECVFEALKDEIDKNSKLVLANVTPTDVKYLLKKMNLSKYYEHVNFITSGLNAFSLPNLSTGEEENLRLMFNSIQKPFSKYSPPWRKNFLNYAYIFRKFLELLSYDWLLEHFSELKSREKLYEQDKIWQLICKDLDWQYIPSL